MKNIFKIMGVALIASSMLFVSCNKDPEEDNTPIEETTYTVKVTCNDNTMGTVTITPAKESYKQGDLVIIKAVANDGFRFVKWNDGTEDIATENYEWTVTGNKTFTATFEAIPQPSWTVVFDGTNLDVAGFHKGAYMAQYHIYRFECAKQGTSAGQRAFPYLDCYMTDGETAADIAGSDYTELYHETYYNDGQYNYGDWQTKEFTNFNCTALDLEEGLMSATFAAVMFSYKDYYEDELDMDECAQKNLAVTFENITFAASK